MPGSKVAHFGVFEADLTTGELRKRGIKLKIQEQPFRVLALLMQGAGLVVIREEIRRALWPQDTFVDFENGLNAAVAKLRQALGDSAENPRFIETLPWRGYRFMVPARSGRMRRNQRRCFRRSRPSAYSRLSGRAAKPGAG